MPFNLPAKFPVTTHLPSTAQIINTLEIGTDHQSQIGYGRVDSNNQPIGDYHG